ncbi:MAG: (2Fe-2S)-binding protein [Ancylobacter novellus]|uniref:(2Fe-2S)-binding protein n=1 Tax=Ancylobacter novellus TaxID=921 RepID=A0A2W5SKW3_ANCNO|nr:MAG: (2Fe-2S)-binding protein [Ancylobacter novellus]
MDASPGESHGLPITLTINGSPWTLTVTPWVTLLDLLREQVGLTGTKKGCDHGQCGACTVLIDGQRINSCLTLAVSRDGAEITTVEGLSDGIALHPLQQAFIEHDAFQCGYCTPGQLCSAAGLITFSQVWVCRAPLSSARRSGDGLRSTMPVEELQPYGLWR